MDPRTLSPAELRRRVRRPAGEHRATPWLKRINRWPSAYITWLFLRTPITPNGVSALALGVFALGAVGVASARPGWVLVGCVLWLLSLVLGAVDGELARIRGLSSWLGVYYDYLVTCWLKPTLLVAAVAANRMAVHDADWLPLVALWAVIAATPFEHAARYWVWIQRLKATDDAARACAEPQDAGPPEPEHRGLVGSLAAVSDGHAHAGAWLVTLAVLFDQGVPLAFGALDFLFACWVVPGPLLKLWLALGPGKVAAQERAYARMLVEIADPHLQNFQRVSWADPDASGPEP